MEDPASSNPNRPQPQSPLFEDLRPFAQSIRWAVLLFVALGILVPAEIPLEDWRRWVIWLAVLFLGLYWYVATRYLFSLSRSSSWVAYVSILVTCAVLASGDLMLVTFDVTPVYTLAVIVTAILWTRRAAFFAATATSVATLAVALVNHRTPFFESGILIDPLVYFIAAFLISQLSQTLTKRWQVAVAEADEQRRKLAYRNDELEGLYSIAQALGNLEKPDAVFRQVTERMARLVKADMCLIAIVTREGNQLQGIPPGYGLDDEQVKRFRTPAISPEVLNEWDIVKQDCYFANDLDDLDPRLREFVASHQVRQFVSAKMKLHGHATGVIFAANRTDGAPFSADDANLLRLFAGQAAIVVENARLYQEAQANLRDISRLYAISSQLALESDPDEIPQYVVQGIAEALNAPAATIALLDESSGQLKYSATIGVPAEALQIPFRENGIGMTVLRSGKPRFIEDAQTVPDASPVTRVWSYRAAACLPIQRGGKELGVLYVNYPEPHQFTPIEKEMLAVFANQVAITLDNAKLLRAEQRRSVELAVLANLSRSLAETMDLEEIFRVFEQQVRPRMMAADGGVLFIFDPRSDALIPRASFGYDREIMQMIALRPGESVAGEVFQTNRPAFYSGRDAVRQARRTLRPDNQALFAAAASRSGMPQNVIGAPLHAGGETLGVVLLDSFQSPHAFSQDDLQFLSAMADRLALAIHNAQLYARERRRAAQLATVNELGHRVTWILDLDHLAPTLVQQIRENFGYRFIHLFINDPENQVTVLRAAVGATTTELLPGHFALQFNQGIVGWTAAHGQKIVANDVSREPRFLFHPAVPETRAEIAVPLVVGTRVIGVLDIQSEQLNAFEPSDVTTLETLAGQIAIALENARLYSEMQEQARRDSLTQVYNHGYFLRRLGEEIERAQRESRLLSLIMLDVDFFKDYNDQYGHVIGDQVLSKIVQSIRHHVKHTDLVGRWGGEEFCIALLDTDAPGAYAVAERIRQTLATTIITGKDGSPIPSPTVSQGIATFPVHARDSATLIDLADAALYQAKSQGRDQIHVATETR